MKIRDYEKWINEDEDFQFKKDRKNNTFKKMKRIDPLESELKFPDSKKFKKK